MPLLTAQNVHGRVHFGTLLTAVPRQAAPLTQQQLGCVLEAARLTRWGPVEASAQKCADADQVAQLPNRFGVHNISLRHPGIGNDSCLVPAEPCKRRLPGLRQAVVEHGHKLPANARPSKNQHRPCCRHGMRVSALSSLQPCQKPPIKVKPELDDVDLA